MLKSLLERLERQEESFRSAMCARASCNYVQGSTAGRHPGCEPEKRARESEAESAVQAGHSIRHGSRFGLPKTLGSKFFHTTYEYMSVNY